MKEVYNRNGSKNWSETEILILQQNLNKSNEEIRAILNYERTIPAIKIKKYEQGLKKEYNKKSMA